MIMKWLSGHHLMLEYLSASIVFGWVLGLVAVYIVLTRCSDEGFIGRAVKHGA
jgi:hypothetical protein